MKKLLVICTLFACTSSFAAIAAASQYFIACNEVWKIDANASQAEVIYWMDVIEANCD